MHEKNLKPAGALTLSRASLNNPGAPSYSPAQLPAPYHRFQPDKSKLSKTKLQKKSHHPIIVFNPGDFLLGVVICLAEC